MKLSQNSGTPIYKQIADQFKEDILGGKYENGEYLTIDICRTIREAEAATQKILSLL